MTGLRPGRVRADDGGRESANQLFLDGRSLLDLGEIEHQCVEKERDELLGCF